MNLFCQILLFICLHQVISHSLDANFKRSDTRAVYKEITKNGHKLLPVNKQPGDKMRYTSPRKNRKQKKIIGRSEKTFLKRPGNNVKPFIKKQRKKNIISKKRYESRPKKNSGSMKPGTSESKVGRQRKAQKNRSVTKHSVHAFHGKKQSRKEKHKKRSRFNKKNIKKGHQKPRLSKHQKLINESINKKQMSKESKNGGKIKNGMLIEEYKIVDGRGGKSTGLIFTALPGTTEKSILNDQLKGSATTISKIWSKSEQSKKELILKEGEPLTSSPLKLVKEVPTEGFVESNGKPDEYSTTTATLDPKIEEVIKNAEKRSGQRFSPLLKQVYYRLHSKLSTEPPRKKTEKEERDEKKINALKEYQRKYKAGLRNQYDIYFVKTTTLVPTTAFIGEAVQAFNLPSNYTKKLNKQTKKIRSQDERTAAVKAISYKTCRFENTMECVDFDQLLSGAPELSRKIVEEYNIQTNAIDKTTGKGERAIEQRAFEILKGFREIYQDCGYIIGKLPFVEPYLHQFSENCEIFWLSVENIMFFPTSSD